MLHGNLNKIENIEEYSFQIRKVLEFFKDKDLSRYAAGEYKEDGFNFFVKDCKTMRYKDTNLEGHLRFIDVQIMAKGEEKIGYSTKHSNVKVLDYNEEKDIVFYETNDKENYISMLKDDFAIFFPEDLHRPLIAVETPITIKKIIAKVPVF